MESIDPIKRRVLRHRGPCTCLFISAMLAAPLALCAQPESVPAGSPPTTTVKEPRLGLELNKLEQQGEDCVIWTVLENRLDAALEVLKLDLVFFDTDGLIHRRLALEAGPLPKGKTLVKVFKVPDLRCDGLARVLVNDIVSCRGMLGAVDGCLDQLRPSSLGEVTLIK